MAELAKFLFDTEFAPGSSASKVPPQQVEKTYWTTAERDEAATESYERGRQAGLQEANAQSAAQTAATLEMIATNVNALTSQLETENARLKSEGIILARLIARSLASALVQREPLLEMEALFDEALSFMPNIPHIAVRVNEAHLDASRERLDAVAADRGFAGKLILLADTNVQSGDCRIEWSNGSIIKNQLEVTKKIHALTARYIHGDHETAAAELENFDFTTLALTNERSENVPASNKAERVDADGLLEDL